MFESPGASYILKVQFDDDKSGVILIFVIDFKDVNACKNVTGFAV